jgi:hypothetical protein
MRRHALPPDSPVLHGNGSSQPGASGGHDCRFLTGKMAPRIGRSVGMWRRSGFLLDPRKRERLYFSKNVLTIFMEGLKQEHKRVGASAGIFSWNSTRTHFRYGHDAVSAWIFGEPGSHWFWNAREVFS